MKHGVARTGVRLEQVCRIPGLDIRTQIVCILWHKVTASPSGSSGSKFIGNDLIVHVRHAVFLSPVIYHAKITQLHPTPPPFYSSMEA